MTDIFIERGKMTCRKIYKKDTMYNIDRALSDAAASQGMPKMTVATSN